MYEDLAYPSEGAKNHSRMVREVAEHVEPCLTSYRSAIQAGGLAGVWAKELAKLFDQVYTFEPDPIAFRCLVQNCPEEHIYAYNAAIGYTRRMAHMELPHGARERQFYGASYAAPGGQIPTLRIDDLALPDCDLLYLDIEGAEWSALKGAVKTIKNCQPVIVLEDKNLIYKNLGVPQREGDMGKWLSQNFGYHTHKRFSRDVICLPSSAAT